MCIVIDDRAGATFLRKNLHDLITASGSMPKNSTEYRMDVENLYIQLKELLNEKVFDLILLFRKWNTNYVLHALFLSRMNVTFAQAP